MRTSRKLLRVLLVSFVVLLRTAAGQGGVRPINGDDEGVCEPISSQICANVGYNSVFVPNARGHQTQAAAEGEMSDFVQLIQTNCSNALYVFLCSYYFPLCFIDPSSGQPTKAKTCRSLCEFVRSACEPTLNSFNFPWPVFLNCSLNDFSDETSCFGPADLTNLSIPSTPISVTPVQDLGPTIATTVTPTVVSIIPTPPPQLPPDLSTTGAVESDRATTRSNSSSVLHAKVMGNVALLVTVVFVALIQFL